MFESLQHPSVPAQAEAADQLRTEIWPADTTVQFDQGLYSAMARLRDALGDSSDSPRFIETVARGGYRFIAPTTTPQAAWNDTVEKLIPSAETGKGIVFRRLTTRLLAGLVGGGLLLAIVFTFDIAGVKDWLHGWSTPIHSIAVLPLKI